MDAVEVGPKHKEPTGLPGGWSLYLQAHLQADRAHALEEMDALLPNAEGEVPDPASKRITFTTAPP
jgi:hypothetical protein